MTEALKGRFIGCPYHDDDFEACIQYSGQAPCDPPDGWQLVPSRVTPEWRTTMQERGVRTGSIKNMVEDALAAAPTP